MRWRRWPRGCARTWSRCPAGPLTRVGRGCGRGCERGRLAQGSQAGAGPGTHRQGHGRA
uniref:Uncharacterized protein n=1 Tax=uncultured marine virus TaxID=186617 RepID=A0A0F7L3C2_9VIRU|nr:hypothetical protein [uncultured marine virus]